MKILTLIQTTLFCFTFLLSEEKKVLFIGIDGCRPDAMVNITIYDMMGRIVSNLVSSQQNAGYKSIQWNATNYRNEPVSAGLYLYTIQAGEFRQTKKMVLLK